MAEGPSGVCQSSAFYRPAALVGVEALGSSTRHAARQKLYATYQAAWRGAGIGRWHIHNGVALRHYITRRPIARALTWREYSEAGRHRACVSLAGKGIRRKQPQELISTRSSSSVGMGGGGLAPFYAR